MAEKGAVMGRAKSFGFTGVFVIWWLSLVAYPDLHLYLDREGASPAGRSSREPGLFVPLLGAWTLPDAPMLRLPPTEETPSRR